MSIVEETLRAIAAEYPICCPRCKKPIRSDRIDVKGQQEEKWILWLLCEKCEMVSPIYFRPDNKDKRTRKAREKIIGERTFQEEMRFLETGPIPQDFFCHLPELLADFGWNDQPKMDRPEPPKPST